MNRSTPVYISSYLIERDRETETERRERQREEREREEREREERERESLYLLIPLYTFHVTSILEQEAHKSIRVKRSGIRNLN